MSVKFQALQWFSEHEDAIQSLSQGVGSPSDLASAHSPASSFITTPSWHSLPPPPRMSPFHTPATQSDFQVPKLVLLLTGPFHHLSPLCRIWTHHIPPPRSNSSLALGAQLVLPQPLLPSHVQDRFPRTQCLPQHSIRVPGSRHTHLSPADCEPVKMGTCWYGSLLQPSTQHPLSASVLGVCRMNKLGLEAWI